MAKPSIAIASTWLLILTLSPAPTAHGQARVPQDTVERGTNAERVARKINKKIGEPGARAKRKAWVEATSPFEAEVKRTGRKRDSTLILLEAAKNAAAGKTGSERDSVEEVIYNYQQAYFVAAEEAERVHAEMTAAGGSAYVRTAEKYHKREAFARWLIFMAFATSAMTLLRLAAMRAFGFKREGSIFKRGVYTRKGKVVWPKSKRSAATDGTYRDDDQAPENEPGSEPGSTKDQPAS